MKPSVIFNDEHKTSLNAINEVVGKDLHCRRVKNEEKIQVDGNVKLCHFHVMKAWSENLFTYSSVIDKDDI